MAMPDDVGEDLDILRRVFPKWQVDNILSYLLKARPENRVKNAICKYIQSHDSRLNRTDCETDARLVHEIFPDLPFANIFAKITMLGDERNRVRICLRLLLFENGFKTSRSDLDHELDSQEVVGDHRNVVHDLNSTLKALNQIRIKYMQENDDDLSRKLRKFDNVNCGSDINTMNCDKVALSESSIESVEANACTSKDGEADESSSETSADLAEIYHRTPKKERKFSVDLEQLEDFFNNSDLDFAQDLAPVEKAQLKNIQADHIDLSTNENRTNTRENISCLNPFEETVTSMVNQARHELIDLTNKSATVKSRKKTKSSTVTSGEIINLDTTQDFTADVIIEEKRIPEPILEKDRIDLVVKNIPEPVPGPSGTQLQAKRKSAMEDDNCLWKKSRMIDLFTWPDVLDMPDIMNNSVIIASSVGNTSMENKEINTLKMYDDLLGKKRISLGTSQSLKKDSEENNAAHAQEEIIEELIIDEALYFPLLEIFPEACPVFLKNLCNGKVNNQEQINQLISEVLDYGDYPKRDFTENGKADCEINNDDQLEILIQVLPEADPTYLKKKIEECDGNSESIKAFINEAMESNSYPTLKEYQRKQQLSTQSKQYTSDFNIEKYLEQIPDPEICFKDKIYTELISEESDYLQMVLKNTFNMLTIKEINKKLDSSNSITEIFKALHHLARKTANHMKSRRKIIQCDTVLQNIPFLQEIAYNVHRAAIVEWRASRARLVLERRAQRYATGQLQVCCCCFEDTLLPDEVIQCEAGCDCCKDCVQKSTEVAVGEGKTHFPCVGGCGKEYTMKMLQDALSKKLFSKVAQKQQLAEVQAAGLEDLEQCPFCDFANIPSANDRLFRCFNPECMKESCRKCKEPNHIPLRCDEVEKDAAVQARVQIELKLTEALLRSCWKCQTKFIKSDGCNKMTCPKCTSFSCYVCGKPVRDYKHFNGQGGDRFDLCPLYSDTNKLHEEAVLKAAQEAKKNIDAKSLTNDPTSDLQEHFQEYNKRNPTVLPPGVELNANLQEVIVQQQHIPIIRIDNHRPRDIPMPQHGQPARHAQHQQQQQQHRGHHQPQQQHRQQQQQQHRRPWVGNVQRHQNQRQQQQQQQQPLLPPPPPPPPLAPPYPPPPLPWQVAQPQIDGNIQQRLLRIADIDDRVRVGGYPAYYNNNNNNNNGNRGQDMGPNQNRPRYGPGYQAGPGMGQNMRR